MPSVRSIEEGTSSSDVIFELSNRNMDRVKDLIKNNPELASRIICRQLDGEIIPVMHDICAVANAATVKEIIEVQPHLCSLIDNKRRTPLHFAVENGKKEVVRALVTVWPNSIQELNYLAQTPLHVALENNHCDCFLVLMEQLQKIHSGHWMNLLNRQDFKGQTVFHIAVLRKQVQIVEVLLSYEHRNGDRVVAVNSINNSGLTALELHHQNMSDRDDKAICDILHKARAQKGHEPPICEGQSSCSQSDSVGKITEKMQESMENLMKISLLLTVFIFIANAAYESLFDLSNIYPLHDQHHVENLTISVGDVIRSPDQVPDVFYVIMANTITFVGSIVVILGNTWSMASKCSLCYRALSLLISGAMLVTYGLAAKKIMPNIWITVGSHKIPGFLAVCCLFDLPLLFLAVAACLVGKQIFHK